MADEELSKFTVDDLLKTKDDIEKFLNKIGDHTMAKRKISKVDESDYVPDETVDHGDYEEDGEKETVTPVEKQEDEDVEDVEDVEKREFEDDEEMTPPSQGDALSRVTETLNDMRTMMVAILEAVQPSDTSEEIVPVASPEIEEKSGSGQGFSITIGKEIQKQLAEMGLKKSIKTKKPKADTTEHPIEKSGKGFDIKKIKDMTWKEIEILNDKVNPGRGKFY